MFRYVACRICFDEKVKVAMVFVRRNWSIGAHNFFGLAINREGSGDGHMLANGQT